MTPEEKALGSALLGLRTRERSLNQDADKLIKEEIDPLLEDCKSVSDVYVLKGFLVQLMKEQLPFAPNILARTSEYTLPEQISRRFTIRRAIIEKTR